jgi:hypothetical protein
VPGQVDIETGADHEAYFADIVQSIGHKAMVTHQDLKKRGKTIVPESKLRTEGEIGESGVVNSLRESSFTAVRIRAGVESESDPAVKIIGSAEAKAAGVRFQGAAQWEQGSWKLGVHVSVWIKEGISAEKLPLGRRLFLSGSEGGKRRQDGKHCQKHC